MEEIRDSRTELYIEELHGESIVHIAERARSGDKIAAIKMLEIARDVLSAGNESSESSIYVPIPPLLRLYLIESFSRIVENGTDPKRALHLERPGRQTWERADEILVADIVQQYIHKGRDVKTAAKEAVHAIAQLLRQFEKRLEKIRSDRIKLTGGNDPESGIFEDRDVIEAYRAWHNFRRRRPIGKDTAEKIWRKHAAELSRARDVAERRAREV